MKSVAAFFEQSQTYTHVLWDMNFVKITQWSIQKDKHEQMVVEAWWKNGELTDWKGFNTCR